MSLLIAIEPDPDKTRDAVRRRTERHISHSSVSHKGYNLNDYLPLISEQISILFRSTFFHYSIFFAHSLSSRPLNIPVATLSSLRQSDSRECERTPFLSRPYFTPSPPFPHPAEPPNSFLFSILPDTTHFPTRQGDGRPWSAALFRRSYVSPRHYCATG